jgi:citrate synthase
MWNPIRNSLSPIASRLFPAAKSPALKGSLTHQKTEDVLFQITKQNLDTGLRGYPVGTCTTSHVDPQKGLFYSGRPIEMLAKRSPIEVIYLLYSGKFGTKEEVAAFAADLAQRAMCKPETLKAIYSLPKAKDPMDVFCSALLIAGMCEGVGDYRQDCLNLIAKLPQIAAASINHSAGWGATPPSRPELGYMENFVHMLNLPHPKKPELIEAMRLFNTLHFDHSGGNLSAFVGKSVASGLEHLYGSLAAAMTALAGPLHGRANQESLEFLVSMRKELGDNPKPNDVAAWIRERLAKKQLIYGFGHAVLRIEDPRATIFYDYAQKHFPHHPLIKLALLLRSEGSRTLAEYPYISDPHPNVDAISGAVLTAAGFPYPEYFPILFGLSRCVGIAIQIVYERLEARNGKGTPIVRPSYIYSERLNAR